MDYGNIPTFSVRIIKHNNIYINCVIFQNLDLIYLNDYYL